VPPADLNDAVIETLARRAWEVREHSRIIGKTAVGCAVLDEAGSIFVGCNIEHQFRSHDIHAEIAALSGLVSAGGRRPVAIFLAARRNRFTPCGACLDWIFELGGAECLVLTQPEPGGPLERYHAQDLMPHYPN